VCEIILIIFMIVIYRGNLFQVLPPFKQGKNLGGEKMKTLKRICIFLAVVMSFPATGWGIALYGDGQSFPMVKQQVNVTIDNQVAITRIDQTFTNPTSRTIETIYSFPLGEKASVQEFGLTGPDGRRHSGSIEEKNEAQTIYQNAQSQGAMPAIAQNADPNTFETKIGIVPGNSSADVDLTYSEILSYHNGKIFYSVPMNVKKVQDKNLELLSVTIDVKDQKEILKVTSPSHPISVQKIDSHHWRLTYEKMAWLPDADFQIEYEVAATRMGLNFLSTQPKADEPGYFMMLLAPQEIVDAADIAARDIVFVMDTSGSMGGYKIEQTKAAFDFFVDKLNNDDRFNILAFSDRVHSWQTVLVSATPENRSKAKDFIRNIYEAGGTNINEALSRALDQFSDSKTTKAIIFLTDGQPTVGVTDIETIARNMRTWNVKHVRTFVFGVGEDVSQQLLDKIALENRGEALYIHQNDDLKGKLTAFYDTISKPLLVDLNIDWADFSVSEIYPKQLPNVYKGSQVMITGRYNGSGARKIMVSGILNGTKMEYPMEVNFVKDSAENRFVARMWAKSKADCLIQEMRAYGEDGAKKAEVIKLSKTYQFVTPYTSFIAVAPEKVVADSDIDRFRKAVSANPAPVGAMAVSNFQPVDFTPVQTPVTVVQSTPAKPLNMWGAYGFFPLAALAVPNFKKAREQSRVKSCMANMRVILGAIEMYNMDNPAFLPTGIEVPADLLVSQHYLNSVPFCPSTNAMCYEYILENNVPTVRCKVHNTIDNPNLNPNGQNVKVQVVTTWQTELWNKWCAPILELLINIPLLILGLYFTYLIFIRPLSAVAAGLCSFLSPRRS